MPNNIFTFDVSNIDLKQERIKDKDNKQQNIIKCFVCQDSGEIEINKIHYCKKHFEELFDFCSFCNTYKDKCDIFQVNSKKTCDTCLLYEGYHKCESCCQWKKTTKYVNNLGFFCNKCLKNIECFLCYQCNQYYTNDRYGKNNKCIMCTNSYLIDVKNYSYKPSPRFFRSIKRNNNDNLFFGLEIQMGNIEKAQIVNDFVAQYSNNFFYMKKDTSIPAYGCEIVTQPATLEKHISSRYWKTLLTVAKQYGFSAQNNCGVHIHINKNFFSNKQLAKLDCFINTYSFFKKIARRESHYSEYLNKERINWGKQISNRKCALNLSNKNTAELRIFKGTIDYKYIMAYIELCHALSMFVTKIDMQQLLYSKRTTIDKFKKELENKKYKYILNYCEQFKVFE